MLSYAAGTVTAFVGLLVLIGWQFDVAVLKTFLAATVSMKANTAAAFLLAGIALIFLQRPRRITNTLARFCALVIVLVGLLTLCEYLFHWNLGIDQALFREPGTPVATSDPGRMAPNTAVNFLLLGFAFFVLTVPRFRSGFLVEFPLVFSFIISVLGLAGYITGLVELTGPSAYTQMAANTAGTFIILCVGMLFTAYERQRAPITIEQELFAGLTAAAAIIIFISFLSVSGIRTLLQASDWVEHTQEVKQRLNLVLSHVIDVETGARSFILTGEESYAEPLKKASQELPGMLNNLRRLTSDNPRQQEALTLLERLATERIEVAEQLVQTRRSKGPEEAISLFATGRGKALTDSIRVLVAQMLAEEDRLLQTRKHDETRQAKRTQLIVYLSLGTQAMLLIFIFVVVNRDVTGRRKGEEALKDSEQRLALALDSGQMGAWDLDLIHDTAVRSLKHDQIFGYDSLLPQWGAEIFMKHVVPDDREQVQEQFKEAFANGNLYFECRIIRPDQSLRWIAAQGRVYRNQEGTPVRMMGVVSDITGRKRAEDRFRLVVESAPNAIILVDSKGTIRLVNVQTEEYFGYNRDELLGKKIEILVPKESAVDHSTLRSSFFSHLDTRSMGKGRDLFGLRKDGSTLPIEVGLNPIHFEEEMLVLASIIDITERKQAEEDIRQANAQLEAANKELEAFSYSVSHDLRAPLRSIDGFSQALLKDYNEKLDDQGKDFLRRVRAASQRMARLIDDMLKLSRITQAEMRRERVDLSGIAREIAEELSKTHPERRVEFLIADGLIDHGDPQLLRAVLANLLGNSWKYTGKNPAAGIEFGVTQLESQTAYYVRDNGVGFDMAYAGKLFGAFQRLHSTAEFEGTGIGLATVQRIIHRHGGRVWAEGKINEGATFYFSL